MKSKSILDPSKLQLLCLANHQLPINHMDAYSSILSLYILLSRVKAGQYCRLIQASGTFRNIYRWVCLEYISYFLNSIWFPCGCCNELPQTLLLKKAQIYSHSSWGKKFETSTIRPISIYYQGVIFPEILGENPFFASSIF